MHKSLGVIAASVLAMTFAGSVYAAVSAAEAAKLGSSLTPLGAEVKGNGKDVASGFGIPDWTGGITADKIPAAYKKPGQFHPDPYAADKVVFTITNQNKSQYADYMMTGTSKMLEIYPDSLYLNVYPSRRSTSAPQWVYDNTKKNATTATLTDSTGSGVKNAFGGTPFPIPSGTNEERALQVIWNHVLRWRGVYLVRSAARGAVQTNGNFVPIITQEEVYFRYYDPKESYDTLDNTLFYYLNFTKSPARLAGGAILVRETMNQLAEPRQAWGYNAGQRRVRRAPNVAFDMPIPESDGLRVADETDMYNGSPHKFKWRLVHDQPVEKFIPYNSYKMNTNTLDYKDMLKPGHVSSDLQRWELHRVWVLEGTLREGERHIYGKRVMYIDADSWQLVELDEYDTRGELWRVGIGYVMNYYEVPTQWTMIDAFHDLRAKRYDVKNLPVAKEQDQDFTRPAPNLRYFSPAALSRRGR